MALFFDFLQFFDQITVEIPDKMEYNDTREIKGGPAVLNIVLVEPEIPQNTGNIARTCAATRSRLHLIKPLGFDISEKAVRRAGLDYWNMVDLQVYEGLDHFFEVNPAPDLWLATTKAPRDYTQAVFRDNCWLFFGKETAGLPEGFRRQYPGRCIRIPMRPDARSLNLANSVAVLTYEALRQLDFPGLSGEGEMAEKGRSQVL
ncbi:tRNA (cytidine(34)-2'-O)-methyltransferase [uncultured Flavonifractor sp.]|nr:tRNA (cytidine(34)-2'-O)-methyltransferase [uncultured Flavonifractor sp.]